MTDWREEADDLRRRLDEERREQERSIKEERELLLRNEEDCRHSAASLRSKVSKFCKEFAKSIDCRVEHDSQERTSIQTYDCVRRETVFSDLFTIYKPKPKQLQIWKGLTERYRDWEWSVFVYIGHASDLAVSSDVFLQIEPYTGFTKLVARDNVHRYLALPRRIGASSYSDDKLGAALIALIDQRG